MTARGWRVDGRAAAGAPCRATLAAAWLLALASPAAAQTDYYNLDKQRPLRVEDAYAAERYAVELQLAPLTLAGEGGSLRYTPSLELKYGILPGVEVSAGLDAALTRAGGVTSRAAGALDVAALYNFNTETLGLPAFGARLSGHVPLDADDRASVEARGIATRVIGGAWRAHVNAAARFGGHDEERWWAGVAVDYVLPFRSLLLLAETYYAQPRDGEDEHGARLHSGAGMRYQLTPWTGMDLGGGVDWTGTERLAWRLTFGVTTAVGFRPLMRIR